MRNGQTRNPFILVVIGGVLLLAGRAHALSLVNHYSPFNRERPLRRQTDYIILHTTEGPKTGSLRKVHERGETHYFVDRGGRIYRIVHRNRVALHAGRSLWNGRSNLDTRSVAIEVVGYHNGHLTPAQYSALKQLLEQLQAIFGIPDERVLTHSMIAYGAPNRWHRRSHRGRKRCGMLFARRSIRLRLGLHSQPLSDPDVKAGRLAVGDPYLAGVLYGSARQQEAAVHRFEGRGANVISASRSAWDIAGDRYNSRDTVYVLPDGRRVHGNDVRDWKKMLPGTTVILSQNQRDNPVERIKQVGQDGTAAEIAGEEFAGRTTIYFMPDGKVRRGDELDDADFTSLPKGVKVLVGYVHGGYITAKRSAFDICGKSWDFPSTFYRFPDGRILKGSDVKEGSIPKATMVFFRK
ncbi:MAG: N-acetylmuramoyl-L-alanine amidase [Lentisphaerae bacterium]|nr:N-acetylmuramoyl-L-alanine amidase [Lentisphaerota bacterium]